jgi:hypothetical protein
MDDAGVEEFIQEMGDVNVDSGNRAFVDSLRDRIDQVHNRDELLKEYKDKEKKGENKPPKGIELFMEMEFTDV